MLRFLFLFGLILGLTGCATQTPPLSYTWKRTDPPHKLNGVQESLDVSLNSAKELCRAKSENVVIPPQACTANPSRACWGTDYATGACPPQLPEETVCNTDKVVNAMNERDAAFISCMQDKGWSLIVSPKPSGEDS
ncbi:MAG: hypothetical protein ACKN9W_19725 [Methylococcus sp.]